MGIIADALLLPQRRSDYFGLISGLKVVSM